LCITDDVVTIFQNCVNLPELAAGSGSEPFHDGYQFFHIKLEEGADIQEEMGGGGGSPCCNMSSSKD
jgi:hypothetical protein